MKRTESVPYRIGVLPIEGFALLSYACVVEPLRAANLLSGRNLYHLTHLATGPDVHSSGGCAVPPVQPFAAATSLDLLLVVAGGNPFVFADPDVFDRLARMDRSGVRLGGVSGGSVILARAGLMRDRRMTVHWEHAAELAECYPELLIEKRLFVIDRDRVTCGGGTAPLDLMHALIASQHGSPFAREVSDWFLHTDIRAASAPQRSGLAERLGNSSPQILEAVAAMETHIADPLTLPQIALIASVSPRHLNRLFRRALGHSTMTYYRDMRLEVARGLMRRSAMSIAAIAEATGFGDAAHLSNAYRRRYATSPRNDRRASAALADMGAD